MNPELLTQIAYAKRMGVSRQYIGELVQKGVLPLTDGKIDPAVADAIIEARREPARALRRKSSQQQETADPAKRTILASELPTLLLKTRIKSETEKAKLLEIKAKVEAGKFVDIDVVKAAGFKRGRIIRDGMLAIPDRIDAIVAIETDRRKINQIMRDEITRVLEELSKPIL
jgi:hypothetical protein